MMALKQSLYLLCPTDSNVFDSMQPLKRESMSLFDTWDVCADLFIYFCVFQSQNQTTDDIKLVQPCQKCTEFHAVLHSVKDA